MLVLIVDQMEFDIPQLRTLAINRSAYIQVALMSNL